VIDDDVKLSSPETLMVPVMGVAWATGMLLIAKADNRASLFNMGESSGYKMCRPGEIFGAVLLAFIRKNDSYCPWLPIKSK
jgi:hypothetical protein